ncbi:Mediator complex subunit Med11 [Penicillium concentricum]|uniref:Mediator complex subunit Med11 n=1 Tax=Penicillium concentricum TaxID=293559 RepID=A0A9W9V2N1_9EURO|nr:Mediator complex subunit Med11 [Penicillium concentricum]KAJ5365454.1 Mediator complex subunit Med11 [Penicillium concentricum]
MFNIVGVEAERLKSPPSWISVIIFWEHPVERIDTTRKQQSSRKGTKAPLGGALGPGVGVEWTGVPGNGCWEGIIPFPFTPGPMLPLRGPGLGAPPGADIIDDYR